MSIIKEKDMVLRHYSSETDKNLKDPKEVSVHAEIYDSIHAFSKDLLKRKPRIHEYDMKRLNNDNRTDYEKSNLSSYDQMLDLLRNGYTPMVDRVKKVTKTVEVKSPVARFSDCTAGFVPIVPNALMGLPKSMIGSVVKKVGKVLDIYYSNSMIAGHGPEDFIKAGEHLLKKLVALEQRGYKFNLYACAAFVNSNNPFAQSPTSGNTVDILCVKIKSSDKPLDLRRLSFPLSHPGFFRVAAFDWQATSPITRDLGRGRGTSLPHRYCDEETWMIFRSLFGNQAMYIGAEDIHGHYDNVINVIDELILDQTEFEPGKKDEFGDVYGFKTPSSKAYSSKTVEKKSNYSWLLDRPRFEVVEEDSILWGTKPEDARVELKPQFNLEDMKRALGRLGFPSGEF